MVDELLRYVSIRLADPDIYTKWDLVRRHWKPGVLRCNALCLLRPNSRPRCHGNFLALWAHGLCNGLFSCEYCGTLTDLIMQPFMINVMREQSMKIFTLEKDNEERKAKEASQQKIEDNTPILGNGPLMITAGPGGAQPYGNGLAPQPAGFMSF